MPCIFVVHETAGGLQAGTDVRRVFLRLGNLLYYFYCALLYRGDQGREFLAVRAIVLAGEQAKIRTVRERPERTCRPTFRLRSELSVPYTWLLRNEKGRIPCGVNQPYGLLNRNIDTIRQANDGIALLGDVSHVDADLVGARRVGHVDLSMFYNHRGDTQGALYRDRTIFREGVAAHHFISFLDDDRPSVIIGDHLKGEKRAPDEERRQQNKDNIAFFHLRALR
jgi:hypothetical protein